MSFADFCQHPEPEGAGLPMAVAEGVLREKDTTRTLRDVMTAATAPMTHQEAGAQRWACQESHR